jgi:hypothetical protein
MKETKVKERKKFLYLEKFLDYKEMMSNTLILYQEKAAKHEEMLKWVKLITYWNIAVGAITLTIVFFKLL